MKKLNNKGRKPHVKANEISHSGVDMGVYLTFTVITQSNYLNANDKIPKKVTKYSYEIFDMEIQSLPN